MSTPIEYRLRVRNGADTDDLFVVTSTAGGDNPYIAEPPEIDGESLDPLTGKVEVGAATIKIIDAVGTVFADDVDAATLDEPMDWANQAAAEADGWTVADVTFNNGEALGPYTTSVTFDGDAGAHLTKTLTGLTPGDEYQATVWAISTVQASWRYMTLELESGGSERRATVHGHFGTQGEVQLVTPLITVGVTGELIIRLETNWDGSTFRVAGLSVARVQAQQTGYEARIITGYLADVGGRQQLLSKRAFLEEREDAGVWATLTAGYVTDLSLIDALTYEFGIGSTQRIEQTKRVFDRCPDPRLFPEVTSKSNGTSIDSTFHPTLDRASCLIGGPIIGDWGPYDDLGRPVFAVESLLGGQLVRLKWVEGFVQHGQEHPPLDGNSGEDIRDFINNAALEYLDTTAPVPYPGASAFQLTALPGVICRTYDASTGDWLADHQPMVTGGTTAFVRRAFGEWFFIGSSVEFVVEWSGTLPAEGDRFRAAVFPTKASERNPFHVSGHPVEIACAVYTYLGQAYNDTSRVDVKGSLGFGLKVHLRVTEPATAAEWLENALFGPFGFATRLNDDGEKEFFLTRQVGAESVGTITLDDLHSDEGTLWNLKEQSAANKVVWESKSFLVNDAPTTWDLSMSIDGIQEASVEVVVEPENKDDEHQVFGDREIRFELPGEIEGYSSGTQENPGPLDLYVAGIAKPLFDWNGRGAIQGEFHALRGSAAYNALIGETLTLDLGHYPSAVPGDAPTSQRGSGLRRAFILQKTRTPEGCTISFEDRGPADDPGLVPEFTLAADATYPNTVVEVTVTNEDDLAGYVVRWEMLAAEVEPTGAQFVRLWAPGTGDNPFDLPPVCAGSIVWVRGRVESATGEVGAWSPMQSEDLADLTVASDLTTTVHGSQVDLTWTNGETTLPIEVLYRLTTEDTYTTAVVLPAGSTAYTWTLPSASAEYVVGIRYRAGPGGCTSLLATADVITDVALELTAPINPAAWANGAGTFGMECDGTAFPSGTEFWVAPETGVGTGLAGDYSLAGELATTSTRMRFTHPFVAANDGMLRFLKARHRRADQYSPYTAEVSVNPWLAVEPPPNPDPSPDQRVSNVPICVPLLVLPANRKLVEVPEAAEPLDAFGGAQDVVPLNRFTSAYVSGVVNDSSVPETCYVAVQAEVPFDSDNWVYLDSVNSGPFLEVGPTAVGADTGKARVGDTVQLDAGVQGLFRVRGVIVGGDEDAAKALLGPRFTLWLDSVDDAEPPEEIEPEPPIEYPGSCTVPSPIDMDTGWSETGGGAGNVWSNQSDTTADLAVDGSETGVNYWEKVLTVEPDQMHTVYIDVEQSDARLGAFLQIVDGDEVIAESTDMETLTAQIEECDGTITVRWGIQDSEGAGTGGDFSDDLTSDAGWTVSPSVIFGNGHALGPYSTGATVYGINPELDKTVLTGLVPGAQYTASMWASGNSQASWRYLEMALWNNGGAASEKRAVIHGNQTARLIVTPAQTVGPDGILRIHMETNYENSTFYVAGLRVEAVAGAAAGTVLFRDLRYCLGSGVGVVDPDAPDGSEELPDPIDPGTYPPPPVGGARPFGIFGISAGGYGYWNSTVAALNPQNCEDVLNLSRTDECMNMWKFGGERDWRVGRSGAFSYNLWKAAVDAIANNSRTMTALEAAISAGSPRPAWAHFVIDEPFHPRWGGTIGMATLDAMCSYSKSLWDTWPTILRLAPNDHRLTRAVDNCDIYWAEYKLSSGDPARYRDDCVEAAAAMGKKLIMGLHYGSFARPATGIPATPAQVEHYGMILADAPSDIVLGFSGWIWTSRMYGQAGMPQAVGRVRDKFASRD
jgi:hypothetical protein